MRVSRLARTLQSRTGVLVAGLVLVLLSSCLSFWTYHYGGILRPTPPAVRVEMLSSAVTWVIMQAGFIALMLWLVRPQRRVSAGEAD